MPEMEPFTRSTAEMDEMANTLRRLNTKESDADRPLTMEEWQEQRKYAPPPPIPPIPHSYLPWHPETEEMFQVPAYGTAHSTDALPVRPPSKGRPSSSRKDSRASERRPSRTATSGSTGGYTLYPAPSKPPPGKALPPLPPLPRNTRRVPSHTSVDGSDAASSRYSESLRTNSNPDFTSASTGPTSPLLPPTPLSLQPSPLEERPPRPRPKPKPAPVPAQALAPSSATPLDLAPWKILATKMDKGVKDPAVYYFDVSTTAATLASKHGNNLVKVWSVGSGVVQSTIKISCYTTAQARSREYFVRSHAILSEPTTLMAIAAGFGDSLEIWDWARKKRLQTIDNADRWAAVRSNVYESACSSLVTYRGDSDTIDLYAATHAKKPFLRSRTIDLRRAGLPVVPKYPELAFSATSPLLVAASGPRPPRLGHPPPERETLLVAWEIQDHGDVDAAGSSHNDEPYRVAALWQHAELDTALPSGLATYGSVAVSIWIPASYRAVPVPAARGGQGYNLQPVPVYSRHVLIWDFSANSTRTFRIPNAVSCVSPDCRYVAYCDTRGTDLGARGTLVILDATSGKQLWCWPDPEASAGDSGPRAGFEQLERLGKVSELSFAADSGFLFVGDVEGCIGVYEVREVQDKVQLRPV